jgi:hypothetical protein
LTRMQQPTCSCVFLHVLHCSTANWLSIPCATGNLATLIMYSQPQVLHCGCLCCVRDSMIAPECLLLLRDQ